VQVKDSKGTVVFDPAYALLHKVTPPQNSKNNLKIEEQVVVDYQKYNSLAQSFIDTYELKDMTSTLLVTFRVDVVGASASFEADTQNTYTTALMIPLTQKTVVIESTASGPNGVDKVLACKNIVNEHFFLILTICFGILDVLAAVFLLVFIYITRNEDINYTIKIKRLLSNYGSYIQRLQNDFDTDGYQVLWLTTFGEMLSIRDTIQSPILMRENEDKTCSHFMIPTNTQILYMFEIKVEDYDMIYTEEVEMMEEQEDYELVDDLTQEDLQEALDTPDVALEDIDFVDVDDEVVDDGVDVIGVVWPERAHRNKIYRYDPHGHDVADGDVVLVPTYDAAQGKTVIRKAAVAHGNHRIDPAMLTHPLKKIIGVVKHTDQN